MVTQNLANAGNEGLLLQACPPLEISVCVMKLLSVQDGDFPFCKMRLDLGFKSLPSVLSGDVARNSRDRILGVLTTVVQIANEHVSFSHQPGK